MGILDTISENDITTRIAATQKSLSNSCDRHSSWLDPYGAWHCSTCEPPPFPSIVRSTRPAAQESSNQQPEPKRDEAPKLKIICGPDFEKIIVADMREIGKARFDADRKIGESFDAWWDRGSRSEVLDYVIPMIQKYAGAKCRA